MSNSLDKFKKEIIEEYEEIVDATEQGLSPILFEEPAGQTRGWRTIYSEPRNV